MVPLPCKGRNRIYADCKVYSGILAIICRLWIKHIYRFKSGKCFNILSFPCREGRPTIIINFENSFSKTLVEKPENLTILKNILNSNGKNYNIKCELIGTNTSSTSSPLNDLEKQIQNFNE